MAEHNWTDIIHRAEGVGRTLVKVLVSSDIFEFSNHVIIVNLSHGSHFTSIGSKWQVWGSCLEIYIFVRHSTCHHTTLTFAFSKQIVLVLSLIKFITLSKYFKLSNACCIRSSLSSHLAQKCAVALWENNQKIPQRLYSECVLSWIIHKANY